MASDERATKARNRLAASQREATSLAGDPGGGWMLSACVDCGGLPGGRLSQTYFVTGKPSRTKPDQAIPSQSVATTQIKSIGPISSLLTPRARLLLL